MNRQMVFLFLSTICMGQLSFALSHIYSPLNIDPDSVRVINSKLILDGYHVLTLEMTIQPKNECAAVFGGFLNSAPEFRDPVYQVLSAPPPSGCDPKVKVSPMTIQSEVFLSVRSNHTLTLNNFVYVFSGSDGAVQIHSQTIHED